MSEIFAILLGLLALEIIFSIIYLYNVNEYGSNKGSDAVLLVIFSIAVLSFIILLTNERCQPPVFYR